MLTVYVFGFFNKFPQSAFPSPQPQGQPGISMSHSECLSHFVHSLHHGLQKTKTQIIVQCTQKHKQITITH